MKSLEKKLSELIFTRGMLLEILDNYTQLQDVKRYFIFKRKLETNKYECKKCKLIVGIGERLNHYADKYYE